MNQLTRNLVVFFALLALSFNGLLSASAQSVTGKPVKKTISKWYDKKEWLGGLKLKPHKSINQQEFYRQYNMNSKWWDEAFEFLKSHDLETLQNGRYIVDTGNVSIFVSEAPTKSSDEINWETHKDFNDLQYIVRGKARMGITPLNDPTATVTVAYNPKSDGETYSVSGGQYYDAEPGSFFIFSPQDVHKPAFKVEGYDIVKKILIKVRVPK